MEIKGYDFEILKNTNLKVADVKHDSAGDSLVTEINFIDEATNENYYFVLIQLFSGENIYYLLNKSIFDDILEMEDGDHDEDEIVDFYDNLSQFADGELCYLDEDEIAELSYKDAYFLINMVDDALIPEIVGKHISEIEIEEEY